MHGLDEAAAVRELECERGQCLRLDRLASVLAREADGFARAAFAIGRHAREDELEIRERGRPLRGGELLRRLDQCERLVAPVGVLQRERAHHDVLKRRLARAQRRGKLERERVGRRGPLPARLEHLAAHHAQREHILGRPRAEAGQRIIDDGFGGGEIAAVEGDARRADGGALVRWSRCRRSEDEERQQRKNRQRSTARSVSHSPRRIRGSLNHQSCSGRNPRRRDLPPSAGPSASRPRPARWGRT